jgi:Acetoacetate decarboxylase (ADC)
MDEQFFEDVQTRPVEITGGSVDVPILYKDILAIAGSFIAPILPLKNLLPTSKLVPMQILPGKGLLTFMAFDYEDTSIGPYKEFAIAIPARYEPGFNLPLLPILRMAASLSFETYIWKLPLTSEVGLHAGIDIWGFPKFLAEIEFSQAEKSMTCSLSEKGEHILTLEVGLSNPKMKSYFDFNTYTEKDGELLLTRARGLSGAIGKSYKPGTATLSLGEHALSRQIREVAPGKSVQTLYMAKGQLMLPESEKSFPLD